MLVKGATDLNAMDIIDHICWNYKHAYGLKLYVEKEEYLIIYNNSNRI